MITFIFYILCVKVQQINIGFWRTSAFGQTLFEANSELSGLVR